MQEPSILRFVVTEPQSAEFPPGLEEQHCEIPGRHEAIEDGTSEPNAPDTRDSGL